MKKSRVAIFASGSGTNAENIALYFKDNKYIRIELILSNNSKAKVLEKAKVLNIDSLCFSKNDMYNSESLLNVLETHKIDIIVLAGFLWLIPDNLLQKFVNRIINIHPALLPKYGGKGMYGDRVHLAVKENLEIETGITIHYVNENYDEGNIIFQATCNINPAVDSVDKIASKVHSLEYKYYPQIIEKILSSK